jgi:hypothetical protein
MLNLNIMAFCNAALKFMPILLICVAVVPNVQAQLGITSIDNLQFPAEAVLQNGVAQVTVTFTVYYNYFMGDRLFFGIYDTFTSNVLRGSAKATPVPCQPSAANAARCEAMPASKSGTESASFILTFNSAQQYALRAITGILDQSGNVAPRSTATADFTITVTGQTVSTTSTSSTAMSSITSLTPIEIVIATTSPTLTISTTTSRAPTAQETQNVTGDILVPSNLMIFVVGLAAAVAVFVALKRRAARPTSTKQTRGEALQPSASFCTQCGARLLEGYRFCHECGSATVNQ